MVRPDKADSDVGVFDLGDGNQLSGTLTLAGSKTLLSLHSKEFFWPGIAPDKSIRGALRDLTKVSLFGCVSPGTGTVTKGSESSYFARIFPHYVVCGMEYLSPTEQVISQASFAIDDAAVLFYDFDAFGTVVDARPLIREVVSANKLDRDIPIGEFPQIHYFTGKKQILRANTPFGQVVASHAPGWPFPGPHGIHLTNQIWITIEFAEPKGFHGAIEYISLLRDYFGLLIGRPQRLKRIGIQVRNTLGEPIDFEVHWSLSHARKGNRRDSHPHPADVLMDPVRHPEEFSTALANWIERQQRWRDARHRFFGICSQQRTYNIDRLVSAANMFDILPAESVPAEVQLDEQIINARITATALFKQLDPSPGRSSVLGALGRLSKPNLKHKIRFRAQRLLDLMPEEFPDLLWLTDRAVDCRNYFVHGGDPLLDYSQNEQIIWFFADTLEFIFAASDLIEAGWDMKAWRARSSTSHPYGRYVRVYASQLAAVRTLINSQ